MAIELCTDGSEVIAQASGIPVRCCLEIVLLLWSKVDDILTIHLLRPCFGGFSMDRKRYVWIVWQFVLMGNIGMLSVEAGRLGVVMG